MLPKTTDRFRPENEPEQLDTQVISIPTRTSRRWDQDEFKVEVTQEEEGKGIDENSPANRFEFEGDKEEEEGKRAGTLENGLDIPIQQREKPKKLTIDIKTVNEFNEQNYSP